MEPTVIQTTQEIMATQATANNEILEYDMKYVDCINFISNQIGHLQDKYKVKIEIDEHRNKIKIEGKKNNCEKMILYCKYSEIRYKEDNPDL